MSVKFNVTMTAEYMCDFLMYHNYSRFSGIAGILLGIGGAILGVFSLVNGDAQNVGIGFIAAVLFLIVTPNNTKSRAKMQVENSTMFKKPLEYELSETGITVRQDEVEATNTWEEFAKVVSTKKSVIVYVNRMRALIFPKACMGDQYEAAVQMIRAHMPAKRVKIK